MKHKSVKKSEGCGDLKSARHDGVCGATVFKSAPSRRDNLAKRQVHDRCGLYPIVEQFVENK